MNFEFPTREELKANGNQARMMADEGDAVEVGHVYTVSPSFTNGDRSWTECFWEVLTISGPNAFVRIHERHDRPNERFWQIQDRAWYLADDAWEISQRHAGELNG